jgi:hypothetical protein
MWGNCTISRNASWNTPTVASMPHLVVLVSFVAIRSGRGSRRQIPVPAEHMNPQTEPASETGLPPRQYPSQSIERRRVVRGGMSKEHRQKISASAKKRWAAQGGMSSETRQKISASIKKWWATRGSMSSKRGQKISTAVKKRRAKRRRIGRN